MDWLYPGYYCDPFDGVDKKSCFLYVPEESIEQYKGAMFWSSFIIKGLNADSAKTDGTTLVILSGRD